MSNSSPSRVSNWPLWLFLGAFAFMSAFTLVMGAEIFLRFREYGFRKILHMESAELFQIAPFLQIKPRPNIENHVNENSLRGDALDLSPETFRIFTLGGSTTFSGDLPYDETYPGKLEKKLREKYPEVKIQVQNAACDWYSTQHSIIRYLFKIRHFQPHLLIMKHGINDLFRGFAADCCSLPGNEFETSYSHYFGPIYRFAQISEEAPPPPRFLVWEKMTRLLKKLSNPHFASEEIRQYYGEYTANPTATEVRHFRSLSVFEGNLRLMARLASIYGSKLIFSTQPSLYRDGLSEMELETLYFGPFHMSEKGIYPSIKSLEYGMRLFNDTVIQVGQEQNVPVIDIDRHTPKSLDYLFDDVHPTEKGLEIEAQMLFDYIVSSKIIDQWLADGKPAPPPSSYRAENPKI